MSPSATSTSTPAEATVRDKVSTLPQDEDTSNKSALNTDISTDSKPVRLHNIPTFESKKDELQWQKEHMAGAFRIFGKLGFADGASGHISLRDPIDPSTFWINPYAVHFSTITVSDLVHVSENGERLSSTPHQVNAAGFVIHAEVHKARPDINVACHMHSPYGRAWSSFGKPIEMLNQDSCMFYDDLAVYEGFGGIVLAREEGRNIARALGPYKKNLIMQNHGILTAGGTVGEAAAFFIALERACQAQLLAEAAAANGLRKRFVGEEAARYTKEGSGRPACMYMQFMPEYNLMIKESGGEFLQ